LVANKGHTKAHSTIQKEEAGLTVDDILVGGDQIQARIYSHRQNPKASKPPRGEDEQAVGIGAAEARSTPTIGAKIAFKGPKASGRPKIRNGSKGSKGSKSKDLRVNDIGGEIDTTGTLDRSIGKK